MKINLGALISTMSKRTILEKLKEITEGEVEFIYDKHQIVFEKTNNEYLNIAIEELNKYLKAKIGEESVSENHKEILFAPEVLLNSYLHEIMQDTLEESEYSITSEDIKELHEFLITLSTSRIENEEIYCGFIFTDSDSTLRQNSLSQIEIEKPISLFKIKKILNITNGENIFFNVRRTDTFGGLGFYVTHIIITKGNITEITRKRNGQTKPFTRSPTVVSILGNGNIFIVKGNQNGHNEVLLRIKNNQTIIPSMKKSDEIRKIIDSYIQMHGTNNQEFFDWILSLTMRKHGTTILICDSIDSDTFSSIRQVKSLKLFNSNNLNEKMELITQLTNCDGAIVFTKKLSLIGINAFIKLDSETGDISGGARHRSAACFSKNNKLAIVISEDGPLTIFLDGKEKARLD